MKYMVYMAVIALCLPGQAFSQISFEKNGAVKFTYTPPFIIQSNTKTHYVIDSSALEAWQSAQRADFKKLIKKNLELTKETLDGLANGSLLEWLTGADEIRDLKAGLQAIHNNIDSGNIVAAVGTTSLLLPLAEGIQRSLDARLFNISINNAIPRYQEYELIQHDITNGFLTRYYNKVLAMTNNPSLAKLTMTDYYRFYETLKPLYDRVSGSLQQLYKQVTPEILEALYVSHQSFGDYKDNSPYVKLLKQPYFRRWLWSTGGIIKLNPLDFTAARLMDTVPELDLLSRTFSKKEFVTRNNRLVDENKSNMQKLLHPAPVANRVRFPVGNPGGGLYFILDAKKKELEMEEVRPLDKGEKINLLLLNIDKGYSAQYKTVSTKQLSGKSPTEEMIDSASGTILRLYSIINPQLGRIAGILGRLNPVPKNEPDIQFDILKGGKALVSFGMIDRSGDSKIKYLPNPVVPTQADIFWDDLKTQLMAIINQIMDGETSDLTFYNWGPIQGKGFDDNVFKSVQKRFKKDVADTLATRSLPKLRNLQQRIISNYLGKMYTQVLAPIFITALRQDSTYMAQLIDILSFSSLPVAETEVDPDTVPRMRSALLVIDDKADNVEQKVQVSKIQDAKKDSTALVSFSYKKGRHSLVEVSFGLGYTFQRVWIQNQQQNKVSSKDERFRGIAAVHFYPFKGKTYRGLYRIDEPFFGSLNRVNFMLGVGVPSPLSHYYLGAGYDFGPGLKLNTGLHIQRYKQYKVLNDEIISKDPKYKLLFPFVSLGLNPEMVVGRIVNLF